MKHKPEDTIHGKKITRKEAMRNFNDDTTWKQMLEDRDQLDKCLTAATASNVELRQEIALLKEQTRVGDVAFQHLFTESRKLEEEQKIMLSLLQQCYDWFWDDTHKIDLPVDRIKAVLVRHHKLPSPSAAAKFPNPPPPAATTDTQSPQSGSAQAGGSDTKAAGGTDGAYAAAVSTT